MAAVKLMKAKNWRLRLIWLMASFSCFTNAADVLKVSTLLKPKVFERVTKEREVMAYAELKSAADSQPSVLKASASANPDRLYHFYVAALVRASQTQVFGALKNYESFKEIIPFVKLAKWHKDSKTLELQGGIWAFELHSFFQFDEAQAPNAISFAITQGHFQGMRGKILLEQWGEKGTLIHISGEKRGTDWPPTIVIERGAEIVLGVAGKNMRSYIEEQKRVAQEPPPKRERPTP